MTTTELPPQTELRPAKAKQLPLFDGYAVQTLVLQLAGGLELPLSTEEHRAIDGDLKLRSAAVVTVKLPGGHTFDLSAHVVSKTAKIRKDAEGAEDVVRVVRVAINGVEDQGE